MAFGKRGRAPALILASTNFFFSSDYSSGINFLGSKARWGRWRTDQMPAYKCSARRSPFSNFFLFFSFLHTYLVSVLRDQDIGVLV